MLKLIEKIKALYNIKTLIEEIKGLQTDLLNLKIRVSMLESLDIGSQINEIKSATNRIKQISEK